MVAGSVSSAPVVITLADAAGAVAIEDEEAPYPRLVKPRSVPYDVDGVAP